MGRRARRALAEDGGGPAGGTQFLLERGATLGDVVSLSDDEAHHALHVLRLSQGQIVAATDGRGGRYRLRLTRIGGGGVQATVLAREDVPVAVPRIDVGIGAGRRERFLWCVEKLTELETAGIVPLLSEAVQGARLLRAGEGARLSERARARAAAALKQSLGAHAPDVREPVDLERWAREPFAGASLVLAMPASAMASLAVTAAGGSAADARAVRVAVGPEGGFLPAEETLLIECGFVPVHLGERRLRFETAALVAVSQLRAAAALRERGALRPEEACAS